MNQRSDPVPAVEESVDPYGAHLAPDATPATGAGRPTPADDSTGIVRNRAIAFFYFLSFCSGVAALVYEITWAKMLALTFGSTTLAAAAVIAGFMGGMGIGAKLYHLIHDRFPRPILIYFGLEVGIAATTAVLSRTFYLFPELYAEASGVVASDVMLSVLRFVVIFLILLLPAALMGATFPALCTAMIHSARSVDRHLGLIYGINTIGAAAGALVAGLFFVEHFGLIGSVNAANAINVFVAVGALWLLRAQFSEKRAHAAATEPTAIPTWLPRWVTGTVLLLSGFATLGYEMLWFRAIRYFVGNATYALTTVLVIFLIGLGAGSLLLRVVVARFSPERALAMVQVVIGVLAMGAMAIQALFLENESLRESISIFSSEFRVRPWPVRLLMSAGVSMLIMLPPTLLMGLSFPLASRLYLGDVRQLGDRIGGAYLLANIGSILGVVAGATLLLPLFGTIGGTKVLALLNIWLAVLVLLSTRSSRLKPAQPAPSPDSSDSLSKQHDRLSEVRRGSGRSVLISTCLLAAVALLLMAALPATHTLRGEQLGKAPQFVPWDDIAEVYLEEGDLATIQVIHEKGDPSKMAMAIDGNLIAWSEGYRRTRMYQKEVLLAHLPMILDTRIRTTLNVGLGGGPTLFALAKYPGIEVLDCVEINAGVVEGAQYFSESAVLEDPRVSVVVDDAVHFLLTTDRKYDLIVSDGKQHPFYSGNAALLCQEFYDYSRQRMTDDALFIQWINLRTLRQDFEVILRTMCQSFPYVEAFYMPEVNVLLVGATKPLSGRPLMSDEAYRASPAHADMAEYYFLDNVSAVLGHQCAGRDQILAALADGPVSRWDRMILDFTPYKASADEFADASFENLQLLLRAEQQPRPGDDPLLSLPDFRYRNSTQALRTAYLHYFAAQHRMRNGNLPGARESLTMAWEDITVGARMNPDDAYVRAGVRFMKVEIDALLPYLNQTGSDDE